MGYYRSGNASVSMLWPRAFAVCDRCGFLYNHKDLIWQNQWIGPRLENLRILVCLPCRDKPQEQLRTFIIPADPIPIDVPRVEPYISEISTLPAGTVPTPYGADLPAPTNSSALSALTTPVPSNQTDPVPGLAGPTPPSSYFSVLHD